MLSPIILSDSDLEQFEQEEANPEVEPSLTYKFDFETGQLTEEMIDEIEAIRQAVLKSIYTVRDKYLIYSEEYGCDISYLLGQTFSQEYLELEVPRLIEEAQLPDDRVEELINFEVIKTEDTLSATFEIVTTISDANIEVEVVF